MWGLVNGQLRVILSVNYVRKDNMVVSSLRSGLIKGTILGPLHSIVLDVVVGSCRGYCCSPDVVVHSSCIYKKYPHTHKNHRRADFVFVTVFVHI